MHKMRSRSSSASRSSIKTQLDCGVAILFPFCSMAVGRAIPVVIGVGDVLNRSRKPEDAVEPMQLMFEAIQLAIHDSGVSSSMAGKLQSSIDDLSVVRTWTWPYPDLPGLLSQKLGANPRHRCYSAHTGREVARLFDIAARRISLGETRVAVVTGGEALASCMYRHYPEIQETN